LFGVSQYADMALSSVLSDQMSGAQYIKWRSFIDAPESEYVALTLPRFLLRLPYSYQAGQVPFPELQEQIDDPFSQCVWGNAAFLSGVCLIRSFVQYGLSSDICGESGGLIRLADIHMGARDQWSSLLEVLIPENREAQLVSLGLMPISATIEFNELVFYAANSLHWGSFREANKKQTLVASLQAKLPYQFVVLRIAHYVKVLFREYLGTHQTLGSLQASLNTWIRKYVADVETPAQSVRARRPLKRAEIRIEQQADNPGWFNISLSITPHMKFLGEDFDLSLNMQADGELGVSH
jgi:type VI secretion system protein ImpC